MYLAHSACTLWILKTRGNISILNWVFKGQTLITLPYAYSSWLRWTSCGNVASSRGTSPPPLTNWPTVCPVRLLHIALLWSAAWGFSVKISINCLIFEPAVVLQESRIGRNIVTLWLFLAFSAGDVQQTTGADEGQKVPVWIFSVPFCQGVFVCGGGGSFKYHSVWFCCLASAFCRNS